MVTDLCRCNNERRRSCEQEFKATFGRSLHGLFSPLFGFDVVAFDDWLQTPDGVSTADYVTEKYGEKAEALCLRLIG